MRIIQACVCLIALYPVGKFTALYRVHCLIPGGHVPPCSQRPVRLLPPTHHHASQSHPTLLWRASRLGVALLDQQACTLSVASVYLGSSTASAVEQLKQQIPPPTLVLARCAHGVRVTPGIRSVYLHSRTCNARRTAVAQRVDE